MVKEKESENIKNVVNNNTKHKVDKIHQLERSIDKETNDNNKQNQKKKTEDIKERIIERMIDDRTDTRYSNREEDSHTNVNTITNNTFSSTENKTIYDLQTLLSQRRDRISGFLYERYQYNTSIKRGQEFLLNHVDSKLCLVVMYADLVGSTKMSMALPVERMAKIIKAFSHELSVVIENYNGFVLKYVGDAVIAFFPSDFNKYLSCDTAVQCAKSMINVIENGINPILEKDKDHYPKQAVKIGIDEGENLVLQYGYDKSAPIDLIGYPMNVAAKITSLTGPNKISIGNNVYKFLHPSMKSEFQKMEIKERTYEWKYIDLETNLSYKVYTTF